MSSAERMRSHGNPARLAMLVKRATLPLENVEMMYRSFKSVSPGTESGQGSRRCHALFRWSFSSWVSPSMPNSSRSSSSDVRWRASRFVQGISPRRTLFMEGTYRSLQASAKAAQSTLRFFSLPSSSPSRITEPRQSTTVPKTSKTRAFTCETSTLNLLARHAPPGAFQHGPRSGFTRNWTSSYRIRKSRSENGVRDRARTVREVQSSMFSGLMPAMVTPFDERDKVDLG